LLLVAFAALAGTACSSASATSSGAPAVADPGDAAAPTEIAANADSTLDGEYATTDAGVIEDITFSGGTSYVMWPSSCPASGSCLALGTYSISADGTQITLTDGATGIATTLAYQALTAIPDSLTETGGDVTIQDLVASDAGPLVKSTVNTALVGTQQVKLVTPVAKLISSSNSNCVMSLPVSGDPSSFLSAAKTALAAKNGTITGTTTAGSFSVPGPLGQVNGTYTVANSAAQLTVSPSSLGFLQSCSAVYNALKSALGS
jgi:hypothetical protein